MLPLLFKLNAKPDQPWAPSALTSPSMTGCPMSYDLFIPLHLLSSGKWRWQRTSTIAYEPHSLPHLAQVRILLPVSEFLGTFLFTQRNAPVMAGHWELINVLTSCRHYARQILIVIIYGCLLPSPVVFYLHLSLALICPSLCVFRETPLLICSWRILLVFHLFFLHSPSPGPSILLWVLLSPWNPLIEIRSPILFSSAQP